MFNNISVAVTVFFRIVDATFWAIRKIEVMSSIRDNAAGTAASSNGEFNSFLAIC